ncbi:Aste57867_5850 [Aphanomyces stellatus]|uniref:Aste57867_5850 protein n=1 Tax=Aphanomyces stellatus TaxID=120398 RepID=A0A485KES4_9STRA|nr:hypothetical protein As57867_005836 [Aphanomyces stellatus]VFT82873.1 Aste57867_5850 [Aphanomyces stellatus]
MSSSHSLQVFKATRTGRILLVDAPPVIRTCLAVLCAIVVVVDVISNNWELNDLIGNGQTFFTPVLSVSSKDDLDSQFSFPSAASPASMSNMAQFMLNYTMAAIYARDGHHYVLTAGTYTIQSDASDICSVLAHTYPITSSRTTTAVTFTGSPTNKTSIRLGVAHDNLVYVRGNTLSNFFVGTASSPPAPPGSTHATLTALGYVAARMDCDTRVTTPVIIPPPGVVSTANVTMYRFYNRAFCTGCDPITELGLDVCALTYVYDDATNSLVVQSSHAWLGESHALGMMLQRSGASKGSLYMRLFSVVYVLVGYMTSQKTVRWTDGASLTTWTQKILYMVSPALYRYRSHTFSFSAFCFNSDVFVFAYLAAILLDEKSCAVYSRAMYTWLKDSNNGWIWFRIMTMNFRLLWLNCAMLKTAKILVGLVATTRHSGGNVVVGFCNFSSVVYIYIGSLLLSQRNNFIDYGNSDRVALSSTTQNLDGLSLNLFDSWFIRAYGGLAVILFVNLAVLLAVDHSLNYKWWRRVARNSLGRQTMYNSTSILTDLGFHFVEIDGFKGRAVAISARSLCTIQWFLTCHTFRFGLPEHPDNIRAMASKGLTVRANIRDIERISVRPSKRQSNDNQGESRPSDSHEMFMLAQDQDGYIHMFNAKKVETQAPSMEVKILADAKYILA